MTSKYDPAFAEWVRNRRMSARARKAVEFILEHGSITTDDIQAMGQGHPPRTIADIRDAGIKTAKTMVIVNGKRRAQYTLVPDTSGDGLEDRKMIPKWFRDKLFSEHNYRCSVCRGQFTSRELQADHRIPFRIAGDADNFDLADFMPLCAADNRGKSWSCENCANWAERDTRMCTSCYWCYPDGTYTHIAGEEIRRVDVSWTGDIEVGAYDKMAKAAQLRHLSPAEFVKLLIEENFGG